MLLIEIDFQKEKLKEEFFYFENLSVNFNVGDTICLNFDKLTISDYYGLNDFDKFREKIYSKATIEKFYFLEIFSPICSDNKEMFLTSEYYIIKWESGDLMHISKCELSKFIKYV